MPKEFDKKEGNSSNDLEKVLIENFVSLQRVMVSLSLKFNELSNKISKLLELFEISAKTIAEKKFPEDKTLTEKIDKLLEQNKTIAKGLSLMYEKLPESEAVKEMAGEYQKSIQVGESNLPPIHKKFKPLSKR